MEISFSDQNDDDLAAKRAKKLALLQKRRAGNDSVAASKRSANDLDDLIQRATEEVTERNIGSDTISKLEKLLPSSTGRVLKRIQDILEELRKVELAQSMPQRNGGFTFARKTQPVKVVPIVQTKEVTTRNEKILAPVHVENAIEICEQRDVSEIICGEDGTSVSLKALKNCIFRFVFSPSAVHIKNLEDCTIMFPMIESSILMHDVKQCRIFAIAQQIRVHDSFDLQLHVAVKGAVILEGCRNVLMAPYRLLHNGKKVVDSSSEQWRKPLDFDWLSLEPSPNWKQLEEKDWVQEELFQ